MKFKKFISAVFVLTMALALGACQQVKTSSKTMGSPELPELKIGVTMLNPFFYVDENGDYSGIDAEIAAEACSRAGYQPAFIEISWSDRDESLQDNNVDCLWSAFVKNGREDSYLWTDTYMQSNLRAITDLRSPDHDLSTIKGHGGMAVRAGSKLENILLNSPELPTLQVYSCGTFEMAETAFVKGFAGALGGHELVLQQVINTYPDLYRFLDGTILTADLGVAFRKDSTSESYQKINDALDAMKEDGTIEKILEKYNTGTSAAAEVPAHV